MPAFYLTEFFYRVRPIFPVCLWMEKGGGQSCRIFYRLETEMQLPAYMCNVHIGRWGEIFSRTGQVLSFQERNAGVKACFDDMQNIIRLLACLYTYQLCKEPHIGDAFGAWQTHYHVFLNNLTVTLSVCLIYASLCFKNTLIWCSLQESQDGYWLVHIDGSGGNL